MLIIIQKYGFSKSVIEQKRVFKKRKEEETFFIIFFTFYSWKNTEKI